MSETVRRRCPICKHAWTEPADLPVKKRARCRNCKDRRPKVGPPRIYPPKRRDPRRPALEERRLKIQLDAAWAPAPRVPRSLPHPEASGFSTEGGQV